MSEHGAPDAKQTKSSDCGVRLAPLYIVHTALLLVAAALLVAILFG